MALVEEEEVRRAEVRLEVGRAARDAARAKVRAARTHRSRSENLALLATLRSTAMHPGQVVAYHRNLEQLTDALGDGRVPQRVTHLR